MKSHKFQDIRAAAQIVTAATCLASVVMFGIYLVIVAMLSQIDV